MLTVLQRSFGALFTMLGQVRITDLHKTLRERRGMPRHDVEFDAIVSCFGTMLRARGLDISLSGAGLLVAEPIAADVEVFVRLRDFGLQSFATVRHCTLQPSGEYRIGLAFRERLTETVRSRARHRHHHRHEFHEPVAAWDEPAD